MNVTPRISIWPEPPAQETGSSDATVLSCRSDLFLAYNAHNPVFPGWSSGAPPEHPGFMSKVAVVRFEMVRIFKFGYPNSEALSGHPLHRLGLKHYSFHVVEGSPWIAELCAQNEIHIRHSKSHWESIKHWIVTFEDETLEVIGRTAAFSMHDSVTPATALQKISEARDRDADVGR